MLSENLDGISFDEQAHMRRHPFGSSYEAFIYPILLVLVMWLVFWADHLFAADFYKFGVRPKNLEALKGILFMPLLHSNCLLYTSPSPRDATLSRMPSSA